MLRICRLETAILFKLLVQFPSFMWFAQVVKYLVRIVQVAQVLVTRRLVRAFYRKILTGIVTRIAP